MSGDQKDCPIVCDWQAMKTQFIDAVTTVRATHLAVMSISEHVKHLEQLDSITAVLTNIANRLLWALIAICFLVVVFFLVQSTGKDVHLGGSSGLHIQDQDHIQDQVK